MLRLLPLLSLLQSCGGADDIEPPASGRVVILGFDGVDPDRLTQWMGDLPHLAALAGTGSLRRLGTTTPPESPVAWTSFATSLAPDRHGVFDFVARDPATHWPRLGTGMVMPPRFDADGTLRSPARATSNRRGETFWTAAARAGRSVEVLFAPYVFPPDEPPGGIVLSGPGVPDLQLATSRFTLLSTEITVAQDESTISGGDLVRLAGQGVLRGALEGPPGPGRRRSTVEVTVTPEEGNRATVTLGGATVEARLGELSDLVRLRFPLGADGEVTALASCALLRLDDVVALYVSPLMLDPLAPLLPISHPPEAAADLARRYGDFETLGWNPDTSALNGNVLPEDLFVASMRRHFDRQLAMVLGELDARRADLFVAVFTAPDRASHMFARLDDPSHPAWDEQSAARYRDVIRQTYIDMDRAVGEVQARLGPEDRLILLSDHGFQSYRRSFAVNTWLLDHGYLALEAGTERSDDNGVLRKSVDWSATRAWALGTGQVYLNLAGREAGGIVAAADAPALLAEIRDGLMAVRDLDQPVFADVVVTGPRSGDAGPDLQLAYRDGWQTGRSTGRGGIPLALFADNDRKWSGDHAASDARDTEGFLLTSFAGVPDDPGIVDVGPTSLALLGVAVPGGYEGRVWPVAGATATGEQ